VWGRQIAQNAITYRSVLDLTSRKPRAPVHVPVGVGLVALLGLFVVAFLVYWPNLTDFFALDDYIWLKAASNPHAGDFLRRAFSFPSATPFQEPTPFWRPLVDAYFFASWRAFGLHPLPYHITNVALHGANAALVAVLAWQISRSRLTGLLSGLLLAVLPTYDFAVTWISSVTELLGVLFYLLALVLYAGYLTGSRRAKRLYWGALVALFLGLLSKESSVTLPAVLVGLALVMEPPRSLRMAKRVAVELAPFAALALAYFLFLYVQEYRATSDNGLYRFGWHAFKNIWDYLQWIALPFPSGWAPWVEQVRPLAAASFVVLGAFALAARSPLLGFSFAWTLLALLPYSFFPEGIEYRYTYPACIPFVIFVVSFVRAGFKLVEPRLGPYPAVSAFAVVILSVGVFLGTQVRDRQVWIGDQAQAYGQFFHQVPSLCGDMPASSHIYVLHSPVFDLYGVSTRMALNIRYRDVFVDLVRRDGLPELSVFMPNKCVLDYGNGRYRLVPLSVSS
jgi:hypothetical protein